MANSDQNDKEFNDYLNGNSDLSKAYRASSKAEPAVHLNEIILSAAKEAVTKVKHKKKTRFHKSRWAVPLSIAAMITLSVSLVVTMQYQTGQSLISEPEVEMFDLSTAVEDLATAKTTTSNDATVINEVKSKQNKDERANTSAAVASGATVELYRTEEKAEAAKARMQAAPAKKNVLKEKAQLQVLEQRNTVKEQILPSAPAGIEFDDAISMKHDDGLSAQEDILLKIKALWEQGELVKAREIFKDFKKDYADFSTESIKQILGAKVYNELLGL